MAAALVLTGCGSDPAVPPAGSASGPPSSGPDQDLETVLLLDFETAETPLVEGSRIASTAGRPVAAVVHLAGPAPQSPTLGTARSGRALTFPPPCPAAEGASCPKTVIEIAASPDLEPGDDDFGYGASVLLEPDQTSKGSNVVQKGFSLGGGSQWKLQVDGLQGLASCVLVGIDESAVHEARSDVTVADGRWHDLACRRTGDRLAILVDGVQRGSAAVPAGLVVRPPGPVRVGGKSLKPDNDQFFGALDDVFVEATTG